jgi:hypothetical protein
MSSSEPRQYIKHDRSCCIAINNAKYMALAQNETNASTSSLTEIIEIMSPIENKVKNKLFKKAKESNKSQNSEEWTEINLNTSPKEIFYHVYSDYEDQIPYQSLETDLNLGLSDTLINGKHKEFVTQKSLPIMSEKNEISLTKEKEVQTIGSSTFKRKGKLDNCLSTWISRNSVIDEMNTASFCK